jgi:hypothetical protein
MLVKILSGSFNDRIDEIEYERDEKFQESLKNLDENISKMLRNKEIEFHKRDYGRFTS